jgi:hypothetical protein
VKRFRTRTLAVLAVLVVLAAVLVMASVFTPAEHFVRVSMVCCGYLLGWFSAWLAGRLDARSQPPR